MISNSMLEEIKNNLADNYKGDDAVLKSLLDEATAIALSISNRVRNQKNIDELSSYIKDYVKAEYLSRGGEGLDSLNEGGVSSSFKDNREKMRNDIIKDGKRYLYKC